jgi:hypothetical protein
MPTLADILRAAFGAGRLALRDPAGMAFFDMSFEGFWRSFFAYVLVAPPFLIMALLRLEGEGHDAGVFALAKGLSYGASVAVFTVAMIAVSRAFNLRAHYVPFVIAYNWSQIISGGAAGGAARGRSGFAASDRTGLEPRGVGLARYLWFIARVALQTNAQLAAAVTALEFALSTSFNRRSIWFIP